MHVSLRDTWNYARLARATRRPHESRGTRHRQSINSTPSEHQLDTVKASTRLPLHAQRATQYWKCSDTGMTTDLGSDVEWHREVSRNN